MNNHGLPSVEEVEAVFRDFRQVLKATGFKTPLQRAHRLATRKSSVTYFQKLEAENEKLITLLPPGHSTVQQVDFLRIICAKEASIPIQIPISLLNVGPKSVLLRTGENGVVTQRLFQQNEKALFAFTEEVKKGVVARNNLPRLVHKRATQPASFHCSFDTALEAWKSATNTEQMLQEFVQPSSRRSTLLRVHWKLKQITQKYYFLYQGPAKGDPQKSVVRESKELGRSYSEADILGIETGVRVTASTEIVQKTRPIPEVESALKSCVKVLNSTLRNGQHIAEMVCDFTSNHSHQWVFLSCQGYTFASTRKTMTKKVERIEIIDVPFLMYPVVARPSVLRRRIKWATRILPVVQVPESQEGEKSVQSAAHVITNFSSLTEECLIPEEEPKVETPKTVMAKQYLYKEVRKYDNLVEGAREYVSELRNKIDFVSKHGGLRNWEPALTTFLHWFNQQEEMAEFSLSDMNIEETKMSCHSYLRVVRGDYNFYYKESLKQVHHRKNISRKVYAFFLAHLAPVIAAATHSEQDTALVLRRFQQLEEFICHDK